LAGEFFTDLPGRSGGTDQPLDYRSKPLTQLRGEPFAATRAHDDNTQTAVGRTRLDDPEQESAKRRPRLLHPRSFDGQADQVVDLDVEQCVEHCLLVRELPVHRADTNAGRESHLVHRGSHSALGEHARRRVKDLATVAFGVGPRGANLLCIDGHVPIAHPNGYGGSVSV